jgi:hypothetical protein
MRATRFYVNVKKLSKFSIKKISESGNLKTEIKTTIITCVTELETIIKKQNSLTNCQKLLIESEIQNVNNAILKVWLKSNNN